MAVVALVGLAFGIYGTFFYEKRPGLAFEVTSNANVYDVRENLSKLEIFYAGQNLRADNKTLRLISLRIINSGQTDISKGDYDDSEPLGFSVQGGKILELPKFVGSTEYLSRHIKPFLTPNNAVTLDPLILEAGEFIEAQALVLTAEGATPSIEPLGKIVGVKHIQILAPYQTKDQRTLWKRITGADSIWIQIARAPVYAAFAILLLMASVLVLAIGIIPFSSALDARKKHVREALARKSTQGRPLTVADQFVLEKYRNEGKEGIGLLDKLIERIVLRNDLVSRIEDRVDQEELQRILVSTLPVRQYRLSELEGRGLVKLEGARLLVDPNLESAVKEMPLLLGMSLDEARKDSIDPIELEMAGAELKARSK